jgi:hypothetical protein
MVRELDGFREFLGNTIRRARKGAEKLENPLGDERSTGEAPETTSDTAVAPAADDTPTSAAAVSPKSVPAAKSTKGPKDAYKIYGRNGPTPVHTRIKGRVFRPTGVSQFKNGDRAAINMDDKDTISVKNAETGHTQYWKGESFNRFIDKIIAEGESLKD